MAAEYSSFMILDLSAEPYNFDESTIFDYFGPLCKDENGAFVCIPMDISTAGMAYKKDVAENYLGTSDRKELEAMLSDWEPSNRLVLICKRIPTVRSLCLQAFPA